MQEIIKRMAKEIAPQLDALYGDKAEYFGDPEQMDAITTTMHENKMGILRVLQAVAAEQTDPIRSTASLTGRNAFQDKRR